MSDMGSAAFLKTPITVTDVLGNNFSVQTDPAEFRPYGKVDVLVIGAGYVGVSAALRLRELSNLNVAVAEANRVGSGASGKSMGHIDGLQASEEKIIAHCGRELGERIIAAGERGNQLVHYRADKHVIDCDPRPGYVWVNRQGDQRVDESGKNFGIDPYPYVLGLAKAAREQGAKIFEETHVIDIVSRPDYCRVYTNRGLIDATYVVAAGGCRMSQTIPALTHLRNYTAEFFVTTIRTEPLPPEVLRAIMPGAKGKRYPFSNLERDVSDGIVDRYGRLSFNARAASAPGRTSVEQIIIELNKMFPKLRESFRAVTRQELRIEPNIQSEPVNFTPALLPHVGVTGSNRRILFIDAMGGHGIPTGTLLGEAAAEKIHGMLTGNRGLGATFDDFASIKHLGCPLLRLKAFRRVMCEVGILYLRMPEYAETIRQRARALFQRHGNH